MIFKSFKINIILLGAILFLQTNTLSFAQTASDLFISEYVEGSSTNKAIEIYNGTGRSINLATDGYIVQMYFNGSITSGLTIPLNGIIAPNDVFILAQASAPFVVNGTVVPDQTSTANWYNGDDAIILKKGGTNGTIIDAIGQIGFDPGTEWGTGLSSTADNTLSRKSALCSGDIDPSDVFTPSQNWDGFATDHFTGLGSHTSSCQTNGPSISINPNTLTFNTTSGVASAIQSYVLQANLLTDSIFLSASESFQISKNNSGIFSNKIAFSASEVNTLAVNVYVRFYPTTNGIHSGSVTHVSSSNSATLTLQGTATSGNDTPIYTIQGTGATSTLDGTIVTTSGIVVGDFQGTNQLKGFYIQDTIGDGNSESSDGIFILNETQAVKVGDFVRITGEVDEIFNLTSLKNITALTIVSSNNTIPASKAINLPVTAVTALEIYEGMLVSFPQNLTVTENYTLGRFGEVSLSVGGRLFNPTNSIDPNDNPASGTNSEGTSNIVAVSSQLDLNKRSRILLDDGSGVQNPAIVPYIDPINNTLRIGSTLNNLTGILDFAFSNYRIQPTQVPVFNYAPRPIVPSVGLSDVKVASFNVLNYFNGDGAGAGFPTARGASTIAEFQRQRTKIIQAITSLNADVIGLMEMENDGDVPTSAIADLVNGLNAATAPGTYSYIKDPAGANGNPGTDAIKQAIIFKPASVSPIGLSIADMNVAHNRPPIAQTFTQLSSGEKFTIIVNHFKSKSCSGSTGTNIDQNDGQGCYNNSRKLQANALLAFITSIQSVSGDADVISVGDYNAYEQEDPMDILTAGGLKNVLTGTYSYVFDGQSGSLDHALVTNTLLPRITGADKWHINSDEPLFKDYNQEFNPAYVYSSDAFKSSDHDPVIVGLKLQSDVFKLQVLHASDFEGGPYGANFAALLDKFEDQYSNTIKLSSGDNWIPSPFFNAGADRLALDATYRNVYNQHFGAGSSNFLRAGGGRADISILNLMGMHASALGNHEFDAGTGVVSEIIGYEISGTEVRWMGVQFPYLSSNLTFSGDPSLSPLFTDQILNSTSYLSRPDTLKSSSPKRKIAPATIVNINGEKIGVVGATTQILESISSTGGVKVKGSKTNNMAELATYIQPYIDQLTAQGINKIILLSHLQQIALEKELILLLRNVDIVVAGGSSTLLSDSNDALRAGDVSDGDYPFVTTNANGESALIVNTDQEYKYLGRLIVDFDANGSIILSSLEKSINGAYATTDENVINAWGSLENAFAIGTRGNLVKTLVDAVNNVIITKDGNILGKTSVFLEGRRTEVRTQETNLGNISSDANIFIGKTYDNLVKVSIKNGGGIRASIGEITANPATGEYDELPPQANPLSGKLSGEISQLDVENSLRFNNTLSLITITPRQLLQVLNHGVAAVAPGATPGQFAQVGGVSFSYDPLLAAGKRVKNIAIIDEQKNILDVIAKNGVIVGDTNRPIRVVTLSFLLTGGDGYPFRTFITQNAAFANRVDLLIPGTTRSGNATFADNGSEQDAFAEYLGAKFKSIAYNEVDTDMNKDKRIQNLSVRPDSVLSNIDPVITITNPTTGTSVIAGSEVTVKISITNNFSNSVKNVTLYNGTNIIGVDSISPYEIKWQTNNPGIYKLLAKAKNENGQFINSDTVVVNFESCLGSGSITREFFSNIPGSSINDLTSNVKYPNNPDAVNTISALETPVDFGDNYGQRIRGYICAPVTGNYKFLIASSDQSEIWLSSNDQPYNKTKIAYCYKNVSRRAFFHTPTQTSASIYLQKGARYYIEVLHKEFGYGDNLSVAWQLPNGSYEVPIPGKRLSPFVNMITSRWSENNLSSTSDMLSVSPIPASDFIDVSIQNENSDQIILKVINAYGVEVDQRKEKAHFGINEFKIPLNGLSPGMYFIHANVDEKMMTKKFIIK